MCVGMNIIFSPRMMQVYLFYFFHLLMKTFSWNDCYYYYYYYYYMNYLILYFVSSFVVSLYIFMLTL
jgi:hypothetical protein